jgi:DNA-directed RNA polymerase specialized sigma subunit
MLNNKSKSWRYICLVPEQIDRLIHIDEEQIIIDKLDGVSSEEETFSFFDVVENHKSLTEKQKDVLFHRIVEELTFEQIAEEMRSSRQNVYEIYKTALNNLAKDTYWLKV